MLCLERFRVLNLDVAFTKVRQNDWRIYNSSRKGSHYVLPMYYVNVSNQALPLQNKEFCMRLVCKILICTKMYLIDLRVSRSGGVLILEERKRVQSARLQQYEHDVKHRAAVHTIWFVRGTVKCCICPSLIKSALLCYVFGPRSAKKPYNLTGCPLWRCPL